MLIQRIILGMLRLARQSRFLILISFFVLIGAKPPIMQDYIVFEVASRAYDLSSVKKDYELINGFICVYPTSLFVKLLGINQEDNWLGKKSKLNKPLRGYEKKTFEKMIKFYKLVEYIKTQQIYLANSLTRLLKQLYSVNGCETQGLFNEELMTQNLTLMTKLEVMFSKRKQRLNRFDDQKVNDSLQFIYSAIDKQIAHRLIWQ